MSSGQFKMVASAAALLVVMVSAMSVEGAPVMPEYLPNFQDLIEYTESVKACSEKSSCLDDYAKSENTALASEIRDIEKALEVFDDDKALEMSDKMIRKNDAYLSEMTGTTNSDAVSRNLIKVTLSYAYYNRARALAQNHRHVEALVQVKRLKLFRRKAKGIDMDRVMRLEVQLLNELQEPFKKDLWDMFVTESKDLEESYTTLTNLIEPLTSENWADELASMKMIKKVVDDAHDGLVKKA